MVKARSREKGLNKITLAESVQKILIANKFIIKKKYSV